MLLLLRPKVNVASVLAPLTELPVELRYQLLDPSTEIDVVDAPKLLFVEVAS